MSAVHHPTPLIDEHWQGEEIAADGTHRFLWIWQGFNIRLIAVPRDETGQWGYDFGWCYPRDPAVVRAAVAAWNPDTQDEPAGWHKRPTADVRRAPQRDEEPEFNRPRCVHGCYLHDGCRTVACPERVDQVTYIDTTRAALEARCPGQDPALLDLYTLLTLVKGGEVTLQDVHDAWAVWRSRTRPDHEAIVPFGQLTPAVQDLDQPYADAITSARTALDEPKES